ncbi:MAG TPA: hypothetical protein VI072_05685, partial [Polyangiaceae bacterium]
FNDNQVSFLMMQGDQAGTYAFSSVLLFSLDDIGIASNQFEYHTSERELVADVLAGGFTIRTNDNRHAETWGRAFLSLLSLGFMNTATGNQTTHCILPFGVRGAVRDNLTLAETFCDGACGNKTGLLGTILLGAVANSKTF